MGVEDTQRRLIFPRWPTPIFFDQSIQKKVRVAFELVRSDITHPDMSSCPVNVGDDDEVWLPIIGKNDWLGIWRDANIETRQRERDLLLEHNVRGFVLDKAGNMTKWEIVDLLVRRWNRIIEIGSGGQPGPYLYGVTNVGRFRNVLP